MKKIYKENGNPKEKIQSVNCNLQYSQFTNSIVANSYDYDTSDYTYKNPLNS